VRFLLALCLLLPLWAHAACSGSGTTWTCTAGSSLANVNTAISSGTDGMTITFDAGSYDWSSGNLVMDTTKATTLICASALACDVTGGLWNWANWGTTSKVYRISGFDFIDVGSYFIWLYATGSSAATITNFRFDHNRLICASSCTDVITIGEVTGLNTKVFGVIDNNTFQTTSGNSRWLVTYIQTTMTWPTGRRGSVDNLFIEDNVFNDQSQVDAGRAALDTDGGNMSWVVRFNDFTNSRVEHHGYYGSSSPGPSSSEVYENTCTTSSGVTDGTACFKHQGSGEWIAFNNTVTPTPSSNKGAPMYFQQYRSFYFTGPPCNGSSGEDGNRTPEATYEGYPCNRQPGRNASAELKPLYFWNNAWSDATAIAIDYYCPDQPTITNYCSLHLIEDRDFYVGGVTAQTSSSAPFNGTSGVGFGTLARRPSTCTAEAAAADSGFGGVAYWATDGARNWNKSNASSTDGTLYRCSATNTWTEEYYPYEYPHPLRGEADQTDSGGNQIVIFLSQFALIAIGLGFLYGKGIARVARSAGAFAKRNRAGRNQPVAAKVES
jgi:hypothetical protein